jgi:hypothetical protein
MRIAIQLSGQPRFTQDFNFFLQNLIGYDSADWFIYLSDNNHSQATMEGVSFSNSWNNFNKDWAMNKILENLPKNNFIKECEISDSYYHQWPTVYNSCVISPNQIFMMFYNIFKANQLRVDYQRTHKVFYDFVVRVRTDISIDVPLDVSQLIIKDDEIVMPDNNWYGAGPWDGGIVLLSNDQLAIGKDTSMDIYSNTVYSMKKYNDAGILFHPETMLAYHLIVNNIKSIKGNFQSEIRKLPIDTKWD